MSLEKIIKIATPPIIIGILTYYGLDELTKNYPYANNLTFKIGVSICSGTIIGLFFSTIQFYRNYK